jgi:hypothetical protein
MDPDQAKALQREALQHTKDFSLFVLRTCILLNRAVGMERMIGGPAALVCYPKVG